MEIESVTQDSGVGFSVRLNADTVNAAICGAATFILIALALKLIMLAWSKWGPGTRVPKFWNTAKTHIFWVVPTFVVAQLLGDTWPTRLWEELTK